MGPFDEKTGVKNLSLLSLSQPQPIGLESTVGVDPG
jgi:hypothetical protein